MTESNLEFEVPRRSFYCPVGVCVMWERGLEYKECPLNPSYRDMPECKGCKLKKDARWEEHKETWQDEEVDKNNKQKRKIKRNKRKKQ